MTLGINFPPAIAAAIRRAGYRSGSISQTLHALIDQDRLATLLAADAALLARLSNPASDHP